MAYHSESEAEAGDEEHEGPLQFSGNRCAYRVRDREVEGERPALQQEEVPTRAPLQGRSEDCVDHYLHHSARRATRTTHDDNRE